MLKCILEKSGTARRNFARKLLAVGGWLVLHQHVANRYSRSILLSNNPKELSRVDIRAMRRVDVNLHDIAKFDGKCCVDKPTDPTSSLSYVGETKGLNVSDHQSEACVLGPDDEGS